MYETVHIAHDDPNELAKMVDSVTNDLRDDPAVRLVKDTQYTVSQRWRLDGGQGAAVHHAWITCWRQP